MAKDKKTREDRFVGDAGEGWIIIPPVIANKTILNKNKKNDQNKNRD